MPRIPSTPTVARFVEVWSTDFKEAVKKAAGKDGRLSLAEAQKLAKHPEADHVFADNAISYLQSTGKKSVSLDVLASEMKAYAQRAAQAAAGKDGRIGLGEGAKLPGNLVEDFFMLRGKAAPGAVTTPVVTPPVTTPTGPSVLADVKSSLEALSAGLMLTSETDAKFAFISGDQLNGAVITPALVRAQLGAQHDALIGGVMPGSPMLTGKSTVEVRSANTFFKKLTTTMVDPNDPQSVAQGKRFEQLKAGLDAQLTDVHVFRFGKRNLSTFIVGRTHSGELAGLRLVLSRPMKGLRGWAVSSLVHAAVHLHQRNP
jgi:hypothetical protein